MAEGKAVLPGQLTAAKVIEYNWTCGACGAVAAGRKVSFKTSRFDYAKCLKCGEMNTVAKP